MPYDRKYGKVTLENGNIPDDEGVVTFRYRDENTPLVLEKYLELCEQSGSPEHHLEMILGTLEDIYSWQRAHDDRVVVPTSSAFGPAA